MAKILFATVPLSGHVNPGLPIARRLVEKGHTVWWYCGRYFQERIEATGAHFVPFSYAPEFNDQTVANLNGPVPTRSLITNAGFYIRYIFFSPMQAYTHDLEGILQKFPADVLISDEWFSGGISFSEQKILPWVIYGNSPLMVIAPGVPVPGSGIMPNSSIYGRHRDFIIRLMARVLLSPLQSYINKIRKNAGLSSMQYSFLEQSSRFAALHLKFNTTAFDFPMKDLPEHIRYVGPVLPEMDTEPSFPWIEKIRQCTHPVVFITQGSVDVYDIRKLILPAIKALQNEELCLVISTGGRNAEEIRSTYSADNLIIEPYIPYPLLMPYLSVMITNGGFGGVSTALTFGIPLIVAGNSEDKPEVASRVVYSGAGIDLKTGKPTPSRIRKAVFSILNDPSFRQNAHRIQADFKSHNAIEESTELIENLIV